MFLHVILPFQIKKLLLLNVHTYYQNDTCMKRYLSDSIISILITYYEEHLKIPFKNSFNFAVAKSIHLTELY